MAAAVLLGRFQTLADTFASISFGSNSRQSLTDFSLSVTTTFNSFNFIRPDLGFCRCCLQSHICVEASSSMNATKHASISGGAVG